MTKEQKEFRETLKEILPEIVELDRIKPIEIKSDSFFKGLLEKKVEKYLDSHATIRGEEESSLGNRLKTLVESGGKVLGGTTKVYKIEGKGTIVYRKIDAINHYFAEIIFVGFDTKDQEYMRLRKGFHDVVRGFGRLETRMKKDHGDPAKILKGYE